MFSVMADEAAYFFNKENLLLSSAMSTLQRIFERSFLVSAIVEKKQLVTQWSRSLITNSVRDLGLTMDNCGGQSYDGAVNMAGRYAGALTLIQHQFAKVTLFLAKFISVETSHTNSWIHPCKATTNNDNIINAQAAYLQESKQILRAGCNK